MAHKHPFIVIVNYNSDTYITACVRSVCAALPQQPHESIIVVDNHSTDGSLERLRARFQNLSYIYNTQNIGFAAAANMGARRALEKGATHVVFVNPDTQMDRACFTHLFAAMRGTRGIASPVITHADTGKTWFAGGMINYMRQRAVHTLPQKKHTQPYETGYVSGCIMAVRADVFAKIGLFDERFFLYYEDADICVRAQKAGFSTIVVPAAHATHVEQSMRLGDQKIYFLVLFGLLFFHKNTPLSLRLWKTLFFALRRIHALWKKLRKKEHAQAVWLAFYDYSHAKKDTHFIPDRQLS